jgi:non-ribosomal peptide synthetase component F
VSKGSLGMLSAYWPEETARYGHIPLERVTQGCVHRPAEAEGGRAALVWGDDRLSFAELSERTRLVAAALRDRVAPGARVAVVLDHPAELLCCTMGALDADCLAWMGAAAADADTLAAFQPDLVVTTGAGPAPTRSARVAPGELLRGGGGEAAGRPALRNPILALARPGGGEVLHSHRSLRATGMAFGSFFRLETGSETALLEPPGSWLGLAALLGAWAHAGTVHAVWAGDEATPRGRVDYAVLAASTAEERYLRPGSRPYPGRIGIGALLGIEAGLSAARRRRLTRRLRSPVLSVFGRNDIGPTLASHPSWFLDDAAGIPLPNVDLRPLDPADGRELAIGWDAVEEAEMGVKSALAPAGGELSGQWLRTREIAHVDPTGSYFLRPRRL